jgi:RNA polymerase II-associated protein 2
LMASSQKPLKSILKKSKPITPPPNPAPPSPAADPDFQRIALQHARILQQHKDLENRVFEAINTLLDYPLHPPDSPLAISPIPDSPATASSWPAAHPSQSDSATFRQLVRIFQPTDYDDLLEERNIAGNCGYALCPNPKRTIAGAGEFKLRNAGRKDFDIVKTKDLEKWCSDDCARRALYVRVQLGETPAWERDNNPGFRIELLGEDESLPSSEDQRQHLAQQVQSLKLEEGRRKDGNATALAVERGDKYSKVPTPGLSFDIAIREKPSSGTAVAPTPQPPGREVRPEDVHRVVEGYTVRQGDEGNDNDVDD